MTREAGNKIGAFLVLDEIQKVSGWSETVKRLWDSDTMRKVPLKVATGKSIEVFYWRERNKEVDFILRRNKDLVAIEIKSGRSLRGKTWSAPLVGRKILPIKSFVGSAEENWS